MLEPMRVWCEWWVKNVADVMQPKFEEKEGDGDITELVAQMDVCLSQWDEEQHIDRDKILRLEYLCMSATRGKL